MPSINEIVERELGGTHANAWKSALGQAARESLGRHACGLIDVDAPAITADWQRLDDPRYRMQVIEQDPQLFPRSTELLEAVIDPIRTAVRGAGYGKQSITSMRPRLTAVMPALMALPMSPAQLLVSPFSENWSFVGDALARQLHSIYGLTLTDATHHEWRVMNYLILAEYFETSR